MPVGFVFQSYNLIPHQTILSNVELALTLSGVSRKERKQRAIKALEQVGLGEQIHKKPNQLSGGQMQRVAIARALITRPDLILADEPTGNLDKQSGDQIIRFMKETNRLFGQTYIIVTHNKEIADYTDREITIDDGEIINDIDLLDVRENEVIK